MLSDISLAKKKKKKERKRKEYILYDFTYIKFQELPICNDRNQTRVTRWEEREMDYKRALGRFGESAKSFLP